MQKDCIYKQNHVLLLSVAGKYSRKKLYIEKLDYLGAFEERIHFFKKLGYAELVEKARIQYLHSLIWEYSRAKDILHNKEMVKHIKREYRKYYTFELRTKR